MPERGDAALPDSDDTNTTWPRPRSSIPGSSARVSWIGARRFTSSARSIWSWSKSSTLPLAGRAAFATSTSTAPAASASRVGRVALGEVGHQHLGPVAEACRKLVERVLAAAAQQHPRAALVERARDRVADAAGGPGDQGPCSRELHAADAIDAPEPAEPVQCWEVPRRRVSGAERQLWGMPDQNDPEKPEQGRAPLPGAALGPQRGPARPRDGAAARREVVERAARPSS